MRNKAFYQAYQAMRMIIAKRKKKKVLTSRGAEMNPSALKIKTWPRAAP